MQWTALTTTAVLAIGAMWLAAGLPGGSASVSDRSARVNAWVLTTADADERRREMLRRAAFEYAAPSAFTSNGSGGTSAPIECRFVPAPPSGTSAKFDCVLPDGEIVKVKYGRNPEIHAEAAATALLRLLTYPADSATIVSRLRCHGCPRYPFLAMQLTHALAWPFGSEDGRESVEEFTWVLVERRFPAPAIETPQQSGWAWWELEQADAPRAEIDALRLTAMFLAHWDNKSENQRLVCLDDPLPPGDGTCRRPLAMIQDVGATFGPTKANLARWQQLPVWQDRTTCTISMAAMPFGGASFPDVRISEAGRATLAARLAAVTDEEAERLFRDARFPAYQIGTDDRSDLAAWVEAFRERADQIVHTRCPDDPTGT